MSIDIIIGAIMGAIMGVVIIKNTTEEDSPVEIVGAIIWSAIILTPIRITIHILIDMIW